MTVFTNANALEFLSEDGTTCTIPGSFTIIEVEGFSNAELNEDEKVVEEVEGDFEELTTVIIPDSITSIGDKAFICCSALKNIKLPKSITSLGERVFDTCSALESIDLSRTAITFIDNLTFLRCSTLESVVLPNSLTSIGYIAFGLCKSLSSIIIPPSATEVGGSAFASCLSLRSFSISDAALNNPDFGMFRGVYHDPFKGCTLLIEAASALNMDVKEYRLHQNILKEEKIHLRTAVLLSLKIYQEMEEAETAEREKKRRKLNDDNCDGDGGSSEISAEMLVGFLLKCYRLLIC